MSAIYYLQLKHYKMCWILLLIISFRSYLQVIFICKLVYNDWCIKMPGHQRTETNHSFMNWLKSRKIAVAWLKPLRSSSIHHENKVNCQQSDISIMCLWGKGIENDVAVTYVIKCISHLGTQVLALHYVIIAEVFRADCVVCCIMKAECFALLVRLHST